MRPSITGGSKKGSEKVRLWSVVVWLAVWQLGSMLLRQEILLVSPAAVVLRLFELCREAVFWRSLLYSFLRIVSGFLLAALSGVVMAVLASRFVRLRELFYPLIAVIKSIPVASFVILALVWISSRSLSVFCSFLMVLPIIYTNVLQGILGTDAKLLEMADVFRVRPLRRARYIYLSQVMPFFRSACSVSLGIAWKSGIAAEVIGMPKGSIGERLYQSKIYLETADLFAWTAVIITASLLFERLFLLGLDSLVRRLERM